MDDGSIFMIVALIILIGLSAFFSAAETAYNSLNEIRLRSKAEDGDAKAAHTLALVERYDSLLSTILIGNNIVNIGASSLATVLFTRLVGGVYGPTVSTVVMTLLVLAFGEITPKSMAKEMPETMAMAFAPVLSALVTIFTPLNALFGAWKKFLAKRFDTGEKDTITEGELVTMVSEAEKDGELTNRESELIRSAIEFDDVEAQDVLTPRVDVVAVADDTPMDEVTERFAESGYSRLPVYHDTIDNIIGVVHEKDCFAALQKHDKNVKLEDLIGPTLAVLSSLIGVSPKGVAGVIHKTDDHYFHRIEAMEYLDVYDDGCGCDDLSGADIVLLGVSRTSKTPLSMYLAYQGYKVANVPLAHGMEPPKSIYEVDPMRLFGLISTVDVISGIRDSRLGDDYARAVAGSYAEPESVRSELEEARALMKRLGCFVVRTDGKAIEESASEIIGHLEEIQDARRAQQS